ncbi:unnamed protein product [Clonostachys rosea]|uniref:F-box domain-containing protein n=1 Tax=Bionectria ochroleuca TaxID=29856 RepID=A0ABY6UI25_BIOOC|nr:unnamed protein product [Clonostachys rosea]
MRRSNRLAKARLAAAVETPWLVTKPSPKAIEVFSTPELFDMILLYVNDMPTLVASVPRVCRSWKLHADTSLDLKRALFFVPDRGTTMSDPDVASHFRLNPLLCEHFGPLVESPAIFELDPPELQPHMDKFDFALRDGLDIHHIQMMRLSIAGRDTKGLKERFAHKDASWRRMLISQPPARKIGYRCDQGNLPKTDGMERFIVPEGLRMGQLWDSIYHSLWTPCNGRLVSRNIRMAYRLGSHDNPIWSRTAPLTIQKCGLLVDVEMTFTVHQSHLSSGSGKEELIKWDKRQAATAPTYCSGGYDENNILASIGVDRVSFADWFAWKR